ncbi:hypothetical protein L208DRAFT_1070293, partial [Tricholoma matsutake]
MAPTMVDGPHTCPHCGCFLTARLAQGGMAPGHYYLHCHSCQNYHFTFPQQAIPVPAAMSSSSTPQSVSKVARKKSAPCAWSGCARSGHSSCVNKMCKTHCVDSMG